MRRVQVRVEECRPAARPACCVMTHYDDERLGRLLGLLRAPPFEWVRRAQRIPLGSLTLTDRDLEELGRKLEGDSLFRRHFDSDPVAAVRAAGLYGLGLRLQHELRELLALAERVASDETRRAELAEALGTESMSTAGTEPLLQLFAGPSEVEAHVLEQRGLKERLLLLLLDSTAVVDELRAAVRRA